MSTALSKHTVDYYKESWHQHKHKPRALNFHETRHTNTAFPSRPDGAEGHKDDPSQTQTHYWCLNASRADAPDVNDTANAAHTVPIMQSMLKNYCFKLTLSPVRETTSLTRACMEHFHSQNITLLLDLAENIFSSFIQFMCLFALWHLINIYLKKIIYIYIYILDYIYVYI